MRRTTAVALVAIGLAVSSTGAAQANDSGSIGVSGTSGISGVIVIKPPPGFKWVGKIIKKDFKKPLGKDNYHMAMCVANRESKFDPSAYNASSGASGVFQFIPSTWAWASQAAGYGDNADVFDAATNIGTAAWVVAGYGWQAWGNHCP